MVNEGCSTKYIFSKVKKYSKPLYFNINKRFFETNYLVQSNNDLENVVFKKYSKIKNLKYFLSNLPNIVFTRMTGSGSAIVAYFKSKKAVNNAARIFRRRYKNYWYIVSKTI
jgi:4-diphosphocytidyl-2-C-methyl-D-erythritol kinase